MHDVVRHHARVPHLNARRAGRANVFVRLVIALRGMMFLPERLIITAYTGDREPIQHRPIGHQHSRPFALRMIQNRRLGPRQAQLALVVLTHTAHGNARFHLQTLAVFARGYPHCVASFSRIDRGLDGSELRRHLEFRRKRCGQRAQRQ